MPTIVPDLRYHSLIPSLSIDPGMPFNHSGVGPSVFSAPAGTQSSISALGTEAINRISQSDGAGSNPSLLFWYVMS